MRCPRGDVRGLVLGLVLAVPGGLAAAQETPQAQRPPKLVRVDIVLSRFQGETKLSSLPYAVLASADGRRVALRMGVEVPIAVTTLAPPGGKQGAGASTSFQYRNVGTNIECRVTEHGDGSFQVQLEAENSSLYPRSEEGRVAAEALSAQGRPLFRTFHLSVSPVLRDGQTVQDVASTDPVTGEVTQVDLTLTVVK